jgi:hypothetical protein
LKASDYKRAGEVVDKHGLTIRGQAHSHMAMSDIAVLAHRQGRVGFGNRLASDGNLHLFGKSR